MIIVANWRDFRKATDLLNKMSGSNSEILKQCFENMQTGDPEWAKALWLELTRSLLAAGLSAEALSTAVEVLESLVKETGA